MCVGVCRWVGVSVNLSKNFGVCVLGWVWVGVGVIVCDESVCQPMLNGRRENVTTATWESGGQRTATVLIPK